MASTNVRFLLLSSALLLLLKRIPSIGKGGGQFLRFKKAGISPGFID